MLTAFITTVVNRAWRWQVLEPAIDRLLSDIAEFIAQEVQQNISTAGPPASRPGEYPHVDQGDLIASVHARKGSGLSYDIVADAPHARIVEEKRPFLVRSLDELRGEIRSIVRQGGV